jgi:hypothetical protein
MAMARAQAFAPAYDHIENIPNNSDRHPKEYPRVRDLHFGQLSVVSGQLFKACGHQPAIGREKSTSRPSPLTPDD